MLLNSESLQLDFSRSEGVDPPGSIIKEVFMTRFFILLAALTVILGCPRKEQAPQATEEAPAAVVEPKVMEPEPVPVVAEQPPVDQAPVDPSADPAAAQQPEAQPEGAAAQETAPSEAQPADQGTTTE